MCGLTCVGLISLLRLGSKTNTSTSASDNWQVGSSTVDLQQTVLLQDTKIHSTKPWYMDHTTWEEYETELHPKNRWPHLEVTLPSLPKGMEETSSWKYKTLVSLIDPSPLLPLLPPPVYPILAIYLGYCVPYLYLHTIFPRAGYMLVLPNNHGLQNAQKIDKTTTVVSHLLTWWLNTTKSHFTQAFRLHDSVLASKQKN